MSLSIVKQNVIFSMLGVIFNTIVPIFVFPYISRVLGVDALGKYNYYTSAIGYLQLVISFGTSIYGVREIAKVKDSVNYVSKLYSELITINFIIYLVFYILVYVLIGRNNVDIFLILILYIPLIFQYLGPDWIYIGLEKQRFLLVRNIVIKTFSVICIFLFVNDSADLICYVMIMSIGSSLPGIINILLLRKYLRFEDWDFKGVFYHLKSLFWIFAIEILLRYLGMADVVVLGNCKGDYAVGIYTMALKVILLSNSVLNITATALLPRATFYLTKDNEENFIALTRKTLNFLLLLGGSISLLLFFNADLIIRILGGIDFQESVPLLKVLASVCVVYPIINMFVFQVLYPQGKTKLLFVIYITIVLLNVGISVMIVPKFSYWGTALAYLGTLILVLILFVLLNRYTRILFFFSKNHLKLFVSILITFLVCIFISHIIHISSVFFSVILLFIFIFQLVLYKEEFITTLLLKFKTSR